MSIINSKSLIEKHKFRVHPINLRIKTADGTAYCCEGVVHIPYTYNGQTSVVPTLLVPQVNKELILGVDFWNTFQIVPAITENGNVRQLVDNNAAGTVFLIEDYFTDQEPVVLFIEPTGQHIDERTEDPEDSSLELPFPEDLQDGKAEKITMEHDLSPDESQTLKEIP